MCSSETFAKHDPRDWTTVGGMADTGSTSTSRAQLRGEAIRSILPMVKYSSQHVSADHRHLIALRASALNGCRACTVTHRRDARLDNWSTQRILAAEKWEEHEELFDATETLLIRFTDAVTRLDGEQSVPDELWDALVDRFGQQGTHDVLVSILAINTFNRVSIVTRTDPNSIGGTTAFDLS